MVVKLLRSGELSQDVPECSPQLQGNRNVNAHKDTCTQQSLRLFKVVNWDWPPFATDVQALMLSINEKYPKDGSWRSFPRRDLRRGKLKGRFLHTKDGYPAVECAAAM